MNRLMRFAVLFTVAAALCFGAVPRLTSVEPDAAKPGDEVVANGKNLDAANVVKLFLTAGGKDLQVKVEEQTVDAIRFVIPSEAEVGTFYNLMVQTGGPSPALMEQPVGCHVEDEEGLKRRAEEEAAFLAEPVEETIEPESAEGESEK